MGMRFVPWKRSRVCSRIRVLRSHPCFSVMSTALRGTNRNSKKLSQICLGYFIARPPLNASQDRRLKFVSFVDHQNSCIKHLRYLLSQICHYVVRPLFDLHALRNRVGLDARTCFRRDPANLCRLVWGPHRRGELINVNRGPFLREQVRKTHHHVGLDPLKGFLDDVNACAVINVLNGVSVGENVDNTADKPLRTFWCGVDCNKPEGALWRLDLRNQPSQLVLTENGWALHFCLRFQRLSSWCRCVE